MDRILTAIAIAAAALLMSGGLMREAAAEERGAKAPVVPAVASQAPVVNGLRIERVLSLVLALEALRAAPALLDPHKV